MSLLVHLADASVRIHPTLLHATHRYKHWKKRRKREGRNRTRKEWKREREEERRRRKEREKYCVYCRGHCSHHSLPLPRPVPPRDPMSDSSGSKPEEDAPAPDRTLN